MPAERDSELSVMEAVDILSNMAEVDLKASIELEDTENEEELPTEINWRSPKEALGNEAVVRETFRVLHRYFQNMVRNDRNILKDVEKMRGVQAIMLLAEEATQKMDKFAAIYPDRFKAISKLKEYTDLQKYYRQQMLKQMSMPPEEVEDWENDFVSVESQKRGLQDIEAVRKDQYYELFFIKNENDKPYFNKSLLRHIRLIGNFDDLITKVEGEDPLMQMRELLDRELHQGAKEALRLAAPYIDTFYTQGMKLKEKPFAGSLNKAVMALRMAANPKNLIENQSFKSCLEYYGDFHRFLREAMIAPGYRKAITKESPEDPFTHSMILLTHALCCYFFLRIEPVKEGIGLLHRMIDRGEEMREIKGKKKDLWERILDEDESIRYLLKHFPNGPLMRTLDAFREDEEHEGWDPLAHGNFPSQLFAFSSGPLHISVLRIPCPVKQAYINLAEPVEEFHGFLRFYQHEMKKDKHLLINLQDRTSWQEYARCKAMEKLCLKADYYNTFYLLGLPKNTSFFVQEQEYAQMSGAPVFMEQFKQQILSGMECGFFLLEAIKKEDIENFIDESFKVIHDCFFDGNTTLKRIERLNFIEIFYTLFTLKIVDICKIDSVSFTCKDAVDTGMMQTGAFWGIIRLLSSEKPLSKEEMDFLRWIFYNPALLIRERAINDARFKRAILAIEVVHKAANSNYTGVIRELNRLYKNIQFPFKIIS